MIIIVIIIIIIIIIIILFVCFSDKNTHWIKYMFYPVDILTHSERVQSLIAKESEKVIL